jgi:hypothetical protein
MQYKVKYWKAISPGVLEFLFEAQFKGIWLSQLIQFCISFRKQG